MRMIIIYEEIFDFFMTPEMVRVKMIPILIIVRMIDDFVDFRRWRGIV